jgi:hypothetical protein
MTPNNLLAIKFLPYYALLTIYVAPDVFIIEQTTPAFTQARHYRFLPNRNLT